MNVQELQSDTLARVAHDLKSPLQCVFGYVELLSDPGLPNQQRAALLGRLKACGRRMETTLEDLTDASAGERGALSLRRAPARLEEVVQTVVQDLETVCRGRGAAIYLESHGLSGLLDMDAARIRRVLDNLLSNALKHLPEQGGRISVAVYDAWDSAVVAVTDNGSGIEASRQERIFEKFYQAPGSEGAGLGLGLHIAKEIVETHGGRIWLLSSGAGKGATFCFSLPKQPAPRPEPAGIRAWADLLRNLADSRAVAAMLMLWLALNAALWARIPGPSDPAGKELKSQASQAAPEGLRGFKASRPAWLGQAGRKTGWAG